MAISFIGKAAVLVEILFLGLGLIPSSCGVKKAVVFRSMPLKCFRYTLTKILGQFHFKDVTALIFIVTIPRGSIQLINSMVAILSQ